MEYSINFIFLIINLNRVNNLDGIGSLSVWKEKEEKFLVMLEGMFLEMSIYIVFNFLNNGKLFLVVVLVGVF